MLIVQDVTKKFGENTALNKVSFKIKNGEIVALLGKNGAGKSTLLRIMSGFTDADSGKVLFDDKDVVKNRIAFAEAVGYVPENIVLYSDMSVFEYLEFIAKMRNVMTTQINRKILEISETLALNDVLLQKCETLSKGYKKRVEIAGALLAKPPVLLLDEPTEGLDPAQKHSLYQVLKKIAKNHLMIISTHLMEDVEAAADRILLLNKGNLIGDMKLDEFKKISKTNLFDSFRIATKGEM